MKQLRAKGVPLGAEIPYQLDLAKAQENARNMIAKLKAAKVTTVIFAGDPVTPSSLTQEATAQNYFPEWVVLGAAYTDTSLFGRSYDQKQWAHAFGVSTLPTPVDARGRPAVLDPRLAVRARARRRRRSRCSCRRR